MEISKLLATRQALLRQTQLANQAHAYMTLRRLGTRIAVARLHGLVKLRPADPNLETFWASLTALEGNQSVIEEHFADHELIELADAMALATETNFDEFEFRLEDLVERYVVPLRHTLELAGVTFDVDSQLPNLAADSAD